MVGFDELSFWGNLGLFSGANLLAVGFREYVDQSKKYQILDLLKVVRKKKNIPRWVVNNGDESHGRFRNKNHTKSPYIYIILYIYKQTKVDYQRPGKEGTTKNLGKSP